MPSAVDSSVACNSASSVSRSASPRCSSLRSLHHHHVVRRRCPARHVQRADAARHVQRAAVGAHSVVVGRAAARGARGDVVPERQVLGRGDQLVGAAGRASRPRGSRAARARPRWPRPRAGCRRRPPRRRRAGRRSARPRPAAGLADRRRARRLSAQAAISVGVRPLRQRRLEEVDDALLRRQVVQGVVRQLLRGFRLRRMPRSECCSRLRCSASSARHLRGRTPARAASAAAWS